MKKCIIVSDSFKGTLSSTEICAIAASSIPKFFPHCQVVTIPVADGGEGTVDCFVQAAGAQPVPVQVSGPWGEPVPAAYARMDDCAVIEMAAAAGLPLVGPRKNPELTTTFGVGELIRHAVENGCSRILLGLGGSATNDGGCGCAAALGARFLDKDGLPFVPTGATLDRIRDIDLSQLRQLLDGVEITVMCDVENPLFGPNGAAQVYAPQKGADPGMVQRLDRQLQALEEAFRSRLNISTADTPGSGAAGGMGGGCIALLGAQLRPGIQAILELVNFDRALDGADLVITGEGRLDSQSLQGKVISGVARRTAARNIPLVAVVGGAAADADGVYDLGVSAVFGIDREATAFADFAPRSHELYRRTLEDILRLLKAFNR